MENLTACFMRAFVRVISVDRILSNGGNEALYSGVTMGAPIICLRLMALAGTPEFAYRSAS